MKLNRVLKKQPYGVTHFIIEGTPFSGACRARYDEASTETLREGGVITRDVLYGVMHLNALAACGGAA